MYATGFQIPCCICNRIAPLAKSELSASTRNRSSSVGKARIGAAVTAALSAWKLFNCSGPQFHALLPVSSCSGLAMFAKLLHNSWPFHDLIGPGRCDTICLSLEEEEGDPHSRSKASRARH